VGRLRKGQLTIRCAVTTLNTLDRRNVEDGLHPLVRLMRQYVYAYTCCHDFAECRRLIVDDYVLRMGEHELAGRDGQYIAATAKQYRQFPGLALTVHDVIVGEDRIAMHFTEHGRSTICDRLAAWSGISMYRWNGKKLTECRVEQDYFARRNQLRDNVCAPIVAPAVDPWSGRQQAPACGDTHKLVRDWLLRGELSRAPIGSLDDEYFAPACRPILSNQHVSILDMFTAGPRAAFHVVIRGRYRGGLDHPDVVANAEIPLYVAGLVTVRDGQVQVRAVTGRIAAERRLIAASST
jgi:predicted ester cyclase